MYVSEQSLEANCKGASNGSVKVLKYESTSLSNAFITDVGATGLFSGSSGQRLSLEQVLLLML